MTKLGSRRKHDNEVDSYTIHAHVSLTCRASLCHFASRDPRHLLRFSFSGFEQTKSDEGKNERDA